MFLLIFIQEYVINILFSNCCIFCFVWVKFYCWLWLFCCFIFDHTFCLKSVISFSWFWVKNWQNLFLDNDILLFFVWSHFFLKSVIKFEFGDALLSFLTIFILKFCCFWWNTKNFNFFDYFILGFCWVFLWPVSGYILTHL